MKNEISKYFLQTNNINNYQKKYLSLPLQIVRLERLGLG